ncbi:MAG: hypothetical protein PWQ94_2310, partial [Thermoanaerobacterium sp.]|nr:hypothetical protein [Thermoanaerobacterium sp.]
NHSSQEIFGYYIGEFIENQKISAKILFNELSITLCKSNKILHKHIKY